MSTVICESCQTENLAGSERCMNCGSVLSHEAGNSLDWLDEVLMRSDAEDNPEASSGAVPLILPESDDLAQVLAEEIDNARLDQVHSESEAGSSQDKPEGKVSGKSRGGVVHSLGTTELRPELEGVPKKLAGADLPEWLENQYAELEESPTEPAEPSSDKELSDWLDSIEDAEADPAMKDRESDTGEANVATDNADWLPDQDRETLAGYQEEDLSLDEGLLGSGSVFEGTELPKWLPTLGSLEDSSPPEPGIDEVLTSTGPLAGLRGVIPIEPVIDRRQLTETPTSDVVSEEQQQRIDLLRALTQIEPESETEAMEVRTAYNRPATIRIVMALALLITVLVGWLFPDLGGLLPEPALPAVPETTQNVYDAIENTAGQTALVAFEYTPAMSGELNPVAEPILQQLAENDSPVLTVSQVAAGTAIAETLVEKIDGLQVQSLGFLPGDAVGLRKLSGCLQTDGACEGLFGPNSEDDLGDRLNTVGLIVVLTSERENLVNWLEQVGTAGDQAILAGVTQSLGPVVMPYTASGQLSGSVVGTPAAASFERELLEDEAGASHLLSATIMARWLVIVLLVGGAFYYSVTGTASDKAKELSF